MSSNILQPVSPNLNVFLRENSVVTLGNLPAAPSGYVNAAAQMDQFGNISLNIPVGAGAGSVGTSGQIQMAGATAGTFSASALTDNGTIVSSTENLSVPQLNLPNGVYITNAGNDIKLNAGPGGALDYLVNGNYVAGFNSSGTVLCSNIEFGGTTATSATAGSASTLPVAPAGYFEMFVSGVTVKVPYYAV